MAADSVVVDTHALLCWLGDRSRLSAKARRTLDAATSIAVSSVTFWEVGMLAAKGRIELDRPVVRWTHDLVASGEVVDVPLSATVAATASTIEDFHGDPADRFIVATALALAAPLVTKDRDVRDWARGTGRLRVAW